MISDLTIHNFVAVSAQLALVVTVAALLQWLVRVDAAGVRYVYWRAIAALCVGLPWIQSYRPASEPAAPAATATVEIVAAAVTAAAADSIVHTDWVTFVSLAIGAGAAARLLWIAAGLIELRRLRAEAAPIAASALISDLQATLGTSAEVRYVARLRQPVTFGVRRPVVLLPESLRSRPDDIQRAVLAHELLHVQRRDWGWLFVEEIVRAALWYQPAAWWLISRIQLAREEVVDDLTVMVTGRRKAYVEALLAFSDSTSLVPTAAFARRRHLFRRIGLVSREVDMSSQRIVASCAFMAAIVAAGSWYAVSAFPLQHSMVFVPAPQGGPGPLEQRANPITPENPIPRRVMSENMLYPAEAAAVEASGRMTLQLTLDELGRVAEARPIHFGITAPAMELSSASLSVGNEDLRNNLKGRILRHAGKTAPMLEVYDAIARAATDAVRQWRYDPPFKAPISFPVTIRFGHEAPPVEMAFQVVPDGRRPGPASTTPGLSSEGVIRVGVDGIGAPMKIRDVKPEYPAIARVSNVEGVVIMEARIEQDGSVGDAKVLRSIPLLDGAALDAVKQWRFKPTLLNGQPVAVIMTVTINFSLGDGSTPSPEPPPDASADTRGLEPYWSPDRSKVAFLREGNAGKAGVTIMNRNDNAARKQDRLPR